VKAARREWIEEDLAEADKCLDAFRYALTGDIPGQTAVLSYLACRCADAIDSLMYACTGPLASPNPDFEKSKTN
jgi:hypothetical protein